MTFANPMALWALTAMAIPIAIHLFSHYRGKKQPFAAVRFIPTAPAEQLRDIRLTERLLLLVRCLLLALLALLLAQPQWAATPLGDARSVLLSPRAFANAGRSAIQQAQAIAAQQQTQARWLATDFPLLNDQPTPPVTSPAWSLLAELQNDIDPNTELTVLVADDPAETLWRKPDFIHSIDWQTVADSAPPAPAPMPVAIAASGQRFEDERHVRAALNALQTAGYVTVLDDPADARLIITLDDAPCPANERSWRLCDSNGAQAATSVHHFDQQPFDILAVASVSDHALLEDAAGNALAFALRDNKQLIFASRFHPDHASIVGSRYFPDLLKLFIDAVPAARNSNAATGEQTIQVTNTSSILPWLALIAMLLWLLERWMARPGTKRPEGEAA